MGTTTSKYKKESNLIDNPISIPIYCLKTISNLSEKSICKIKINKGGTGTGFFCAIPFPDKFQRLPVLLTNNHVIKKDDLIINNKINFTIKDDDKNPFEILIDKDRKTYTSKKYDITIIEIKEDDKFDFISFLDIDEQIFNDNWKETFTKVSVYLLHYPNGNIAEYSAGIIKYIGEDNYTIEHTCQSEDGSSGGPLLNLTNHKVIGIHKGSKEKKNYNLGTISLNKLFIFFFYFENSGTGKIGI